MASYETLQEKLLDEPKCWLVTGASGFIGSNLVEGLLRLDQHVIGMDNHSSGSPKNIDAVRSGITPDQWKRFHSLDADICDLDACHRAMKHAGLKVDYVLHQAAMCSVALSIEKPIEANAVNVNGFLNILTAARDAGIKRVVYASSSAVYGDAPGMPKRESNAAQPMSPYAATKYMDEIYADVFARMYDLETIGLRYFNIFGNRQDPNGAYAAVIPKWIQAMILGHPVIIYGDGENTRDFCHIGDVLQINMTAAAAAEKSACNQVYNVGTGKSTSLNKLYEDLRHSLATQFPAIPEKATYAEFRTGDIRHSLADINKAQSQLGYIPETDMSERLKELVKWHLSSTEDMCK